MITMWCDNCGQEIPLETNGGCRLRTGNRELSFHLCAKHQQELRLKIREFCADEAPREVQTSLSGKVER